MQTSRILRSLDAVVDLRRKALIRRRLVMFEW